MRVSCPNCSFNGNIKDELIPEAGRNVKCQKCGKAFYVKNENRVISRRTEKVIVAPKTVKRINKGLPIFLIAIGALIILSLVVYFVIRPADMTKTDMVIHSPSSTNPKTLTGISLSPTLTPSIVDTPTLEDTNIGTPSNLETEKPKIYQIIFKNGLTSSYFEHYRIEGDMIYISLTNGEMGYELKDVKDIQELEEVPEEYYNAKVSNEEDNIKTEIKDLQKKAGKAYRSNKYDEAARYYTEVILKDPNNVDAYVGRSYSYLYLGDVNKALRDCSKACGLGSKQSCLEINKYYNKGMEASEMIGAMLSDAEIESKRIKEERERKIKESEESRKLAKPLYLNGYGKDVTQYFRLDKGLTIFRVTHSGTHNFYIILYSQKGEYIDLLFNEIGSYNGSKVISIDKPGNYVLDIGADGAWTVSIKPQ